MNLRLFLTFILLTFVIATNAQESADYEDAYAAYEKGEIDNSYIFLKRSLKENPNHLPSRILMGEVLALSGYFVDAVAEFEDAIGAGADLNLIIESYVMALIVLKDYGKVLDIYAGQLTDSKQGYLYSAKATASIMREDLIGALDYHERALKVAPNNIIVLNTAAKFYMTRKEWKVARKLLERSITADSGIAETHKLIADYYIANGQQKLQIKSLHRGLAIVENHPIILRELVSAYTTLGDFESAKGVLEKTLETTPGDPLASLLLSWVMSQLGDAQTSKETLELLVSNLSLMDNSDLAKQDYTLFVSAMANYAANNLETARQQFEQYLTRNPDNYNAAVLLAEIYQGEQAYLAAANVLGEFEDEVSNDVTLIVNLCRLYINAKQNHKCNMLLEKNKAQYQNTAAFVQAKASLLAARGKLDLALDNLEYLGTSQTSVIAQKAVLAIQDNQFERANSEIEKLLFIRPNDPDFLNLQASLLKKRNDLPGAQEVYEKILTINPQHFAANFNLTHIYYSTNRLSIAKNKARDLLEKQPENIDLILLYSKILVERSEYDVAFETLSDAEALFRDNVNIEEAFISLFVATKEFDKALYRINKLLKNNTVNTDLIRQRASLNFELGNDEEGQKDLRVLFGLMSNDAQALFQLSEVQGQYDDLDGAMKSLQRADQLTPFNVFINRNIAKLAITKNDMVIADEKIKWLVEQAPNDPDVLLLQGDYLVAKGRKELAARFYHTTIRVNRFLAPAQIGAYQLAIEGFGVEGFLNVFTNLAIEPEENVFATHLLGDFYYSTGNYEAAKIAYISIAGQYSYMPIPMVLNNLANIYISEDKIDAAYNFAQQAYEMIQKDSAILDTIGWVTVLRGQVEQGLSLLREAYAMDAQSPDIRYHLAYALHKLGRNAESSRELKVLLQDFPSYKYRDDALALQRMIVSNQQNAL